MKEISYDLWPITPNYVMMKAGQSDEQQEEEEEMEALEK